MMYMRGLQRYQKSGFTIVEILIVVVVIAVLATLVIVGYNGVQNNAKKTALLADVDNGVTQLESYLTQKGNKTYPASQAAAVSAGLLGGASNGNTYVYTYNANNDSYCLVSKNSTMSYYQTSVDRKPKEGNCGTVDGLVGWWQLNGNVNDSSGYGNNGATSGNVSVVNGQNSYSTGYTFGASPACVSLPFNTSKPYHLPTGNMTLSLWVKPSSTTMGVALRLGIASDEQYGISTVNADIRYEWYNGSWPNVTTSGDVVPTGSWTLITVTRSSGNAIIVYANGVQITTGTASTPTVTPSLMAIGSAGATCGTAQIYPGVIDDVRIYNRVLSAPEVLANYQAGAL